MGTEDRSLRLEELPMPTRLGNVLRARRYTTIGDLHGCDLRKLARDQNCGQKTILQLKQLLRRAEAGEFTPVPPLQVELTTDCSPSSADALTSVIRFIAVGMSSVSERDREIVRQRLFGDKGGPRTLEDVGEQFRMTRERVRQIVRDAFENVRRSGGPVVRALEAVANEQNAAVVPITGPQSGTTALCDVTSKRAFCAILRLCNRTDRAAHPCVGTEPQARIARSVAPQ